MVERGFTALKTNMVFPGEPATVYMPGFEGGPAYPDLNPTTPLLRHVERLMGTFREAVGDEVDLCLDLNFNFRTEGYLQVARAVEPFNLLWLEVDTYDPHALLHIKQGTRTRICSGENLYTTRQYRPFFELHAMDVAMVDVPWNGFSQAVKVAALAETYEVNVAPHNYYSHLATFMSAHLCAVVPNVRIMETDVDDVPWKDDLVTQPPLIEQGHLRLPTGPGWGTELNEAEVRKHPWPK